MLNQKVHQICHDVCNWEREQTHREGKRNNSDTCPNPSLSAFEVDGRISWANCDIYLVTSLDSSSMTLFNHLLKIQIGLKRTVSCIMEFHS